MIVVLNSGNRLNDNHLKYLGGDFSWIEKLKLRGIGSTKFVYLEGPNDFKISIDKSQKFNFITLELFKNGVALRLSMRNIHKACLIQFKDLNSITIVSQRILIKYRKREIIVKKAEITIDSNDYKFKFGLAPSNYNVGIPFFNKKPIKPFVNHQMNPEIKKEENFSGWLSQLSEII